jgi:hypothetical protein
MNRENTLRKNTRSMILKMKGATNMDVHWHGLKKGRSWRDFLEENRKLIQFNDDYPKTKKTQIQIGAIMGYNLVLTRQKLTLVRKDHRGTV